MLMASMEHRNPVNVNSWTRSSIFPFAVKHWINFEADEVRSDKIYRNTKISFLMNLNCADSLIIRGCVCVFD